MLISPEAVRCFWCGRSSVVTELDGDVDGLARLDGAVDAAVEVVRARFAESGTADYRTWLEWSIAGASLKLDRLCRRVPSRAANPSRLASVDS